MSLPRGAIEGRPTLTIIDLLEKHKGTGAFQFHTLAEAIRYLSRTLGEADLASSGLQALADYMARDGAAWVKGINFHSTKLRTMIKEMELTARSPTGRRSVSFGVLVISTSKSGLSRTTQMRKLKVAARNALKYLNVHKNQAFLAIHDDTEHLHLHIVYSRYDSSGRLTEREPGKFRRYLMEDVCARVAFDIGYNLEPGAQTVPLETGELIDLASRQIIRTVGFEPVMQGCKARNDERRRARTGHELEGFALEAYRTSDSLVRFREKLALSGIRYVGKGSGAVFIDPDGKSHSASKVNYCLSRGRIFNCAYKDGLPEESHAILQMVETDRSYRSVAHPASGEDAPLYDVGSGLSEQQTTEANRRMVRGYSDAGCGRPRKIHMGEGWPKGFPWGGIQFPEKYLDLFWSSEIVIKKRRYHAELWREQRLLAVHRPDQIVVYTRDKEDLRILLLAAHQKWGHVQLTGSTAFKKQIVDLAAELNVPISNLDLQRRMKAQQQKLAAKRTMGGQLANAQARTPELDPSAPAPAQSKLPVSRPKAEHAAGANLAATATASTGHKPVEVIPESKLDPLRRAPSPPVPTRAPRVAVNPPQGQGGKTATDRTPSSLLVSKPPLGARASTVEPASAPPRQTAPGTDDMRGLLRDLRATNEFVEPAGNGRYRLVHNSNYGRMIEPRLGDPGLQIGLAKLFEFQQAQLDRLEAAFPDEDVSIRLIKDHSVRQQHTLKLVGLEGDAAELYRRYQYHPRCEKMLQAEYGHREVKRQAQEERRRTSEAPPKVLTGIKAAESTQCKTDDVVPTEAVQARPSAIRHPLRARQHEARDGRTAEAAQRLDHQRRPETQGGVTSQTDIHNPDQPKSNLSARLPTRGSTQPSPVGATAPEEAHVSMALPEAAADHPSPSSARAPTAGEVSAGSDVAPPAPGIRVPSETPPPPSVGVATTLAKQLHSDPKREAFRKPPSC